MQSDGVVRSGGLKGTRRAMLVNCLAAADCASAAAPVLGNALRYTLSAYSTRISALSITSTCELGRDFNDTTLLA